VRAKLENEYRGRIAPSPTGFLHLGHARTFWIAQSRSKALGGKLLLRNDDLDAGRTRPEFVHAMIEDLKWFGFEWQEGPDMGGPFAPYNQSERIGFYREIFEELKSQGRVYPCACSRRDVLFALQAPHQGDEEPVYPGTCRNKKTSDFSTQARVNWRYRVPDGEAVEFEDGHFGPQRFMAGREFGDFIIWRHDDLPSYQLACVADDHLMRITEVVRGADLLISTARQILLIRELGWTTPRFFHCPLMTDESGHRLAKRHDSLSLRQLRNEGADPSEIRRGWGGAVNGG
jgi:glutamyl-tRNA synthetase